MSKQELIDEAIRIIYTLREDAEMALNGEWDCTTKEGIETGFGAQLIQIDRALDLLKNV